MTAEQLGPTIIPDMTPIKPVSKEGEVRGSIGVTLLIVGFDSHKNGDRITNPLIWTIRELQSKPDTDKVAGELSIPAETKKAGESRTANILGALAEFGDDQSLEYLRDHLFLIKDAYVERGIIIRDNPVDMAVLVYDGSLDINFNPVCNLEVSPNGWMSRNMIQEATGVRSTLKQAIELDITRGISARVIEAYCTSPENRVPVFSSDISSIRDFHDQRELSPDVSIFLEAKS